MKDTTPNIARYGQPGTPVGKGSLVRAYCGNCGDPIRVTPHHYQSHSTFACEDCGTVAQMLAMKGGQACKSNQDRMTSHATRDRHQPGKGCWK